MFSNGTSDDGGEITFGSINKERYTGDLNYFPVAHNGYWQIDLDKVVSGAQKNVIGCANGCKVKYFKFNIKYIFICFILGYFFN